MVLMFLAMKSITGWILPGSAQPTHVTPVTGNARSWRVRTTLDVTDATSSLASDAHATRPAAATPPKAAPAMSRLAELPRSSSSSSSASSSSYSRGRFRCFLLFFSRLRRSLLGSPRTLAVLEPPSRSPRPRISSSIIEIGPYIFSGRLFLLAAPAPRPAPAAAAHTGCCGTPAACGIWAASTASPCASGGTEPSSSSLSDMRPPVPHSRARKSDPNHTA